MEQQVKVCVRTEGGWNVAYIVDDMDGGPNLELCRCAMAVLTCNDKINKLWKSFIKASVTALVEEVTAAYGGKVIGFSQVSPGEPPPDRTIPQAERN